MGLRDLRACTIRTPSSSREAGILINRPVTVRTIRRPSQRRQLHRAQTRRARMCSLLTRASDTTLRLIGSYGLLGLLQGPIWGPIDVFNPVMSRSE
jgi:hypothetical protein